MNFYFIGLTMTSETHNYSEVRRALVLLGGRKVSHRIWMCSVQEGKSEHIFALVKQCLAAEDQMIVTEVPATMRPPRMAKIAA